VSACFGFGLQDLVQLLSEDVMCLVACRLARVVLYPVHPVLYIRQELARLRSENAELVCLSPSGKKPKKSPAKEAQLSVLCEEIAKCDLSRSRLPSHKTQNRTNTAAAQPAGACSGVLSRVRGFAAALNCFV
jgi:hypothetical protein